MLGGAICSSLISALLLMVLKATTTWGYWSFLSNKTIKPRLPISPNKLKVSQIPTSSVLYPFTNPCVVSLLQSGTLYMGYIITYNLHTPYLNTNHIQSSTIMLPAWQSIYQFFMTRNLPTSFGHQSSIEAPNFTPLFCLWAYSPLLHATIVFAPGSSEDKVLLLPHHKARKQNNRGELLHTYLPIADTDRRSRHQRSDDHWFWLVKFQITPHQTMWNMSIGATNWFCWW